MSDKIVISDEAEKPALPKPKVKAEVKPKVVDVPKLEEALGLPKAFFARFNGKAPHYRLASTFNIEDITVEDSKNCYLFDSWKKPKRVRLSCEWAEKMRAKGKLKRLELPWED